MPYNFNDLYNLLSDYFIKDGNLPEGFSPLELKIIKHYKKQYEKVTCYDVLHYGNDILTEPLNDCIMELMVL